MNSDDCWARDTGPTVVINGNGECRGVDWGFNAWVAIMAACISRGSR